MLRLAFRLWKRVSLALTVVVLGLFLLVRLGPWGMYVVPTGSMEPALLIGDRIWLVEFSASELRSESPLDVARGEVLAFRLPENPEEIYAKRLIGLPGDRLRLDQRRLLINGKTMDEPYVVHKDTRSDRYRDNFPAGHSIYVSESAQRMLDEHVVDGDLLVPAGQYFLMGDNRDRSSDSRYFGLVPRANMLGRVERIYWSYDPPPQFRATGGGNESSAVGGEIRWSRIGMRVLPVEIPAE